MRNYFLHIFVLLPERHFEIDKKVYFLLHLYNALIYCDFTLSYFHVLFWYEVLSRYSSIFRVFKSFLSFHMRIRYTVYVQHSYYKKKHVKYILY